MEKVLLQSVEDFMNDEPPEATDHVALGESLGPLVLHVDLGLVGTYRPFHHTLIFETLS